MNPTIKKDKQIWIADGFITEEDCKKAIEIFDKRDLQNKVYDRSFENASSLEKKDESTTITSICEDWEKHLKTLFINFNTVVRQYEKEYDFQNIYKAHLKYYPIKIQKTVPGGGYHTWHVERVGMIEVSNRVLAYTIYLNEIEGGETEFLHQHVRVKPKPGRIAIWPAGFPYVHRGNPPLDKPKYIITSWLYHTLIGHE